MSTINKRRKVDCESRRFKDGWKLDYFFTEIRNNCVCPICKKTVAVFKEFNVKRHYQTKHAGVYDKITGNECSDKLKHLEASLISQQQYFTRARESNKNATKASYEVKVLITKHCKPFTGLNLSNTMWWDWWKISVPRSNKSLPMSVWHVTLC